MAHLSVSLLGSFQVTLDGQPITDFKSYKVRALLAYLAVEADRPHRREVLAGLLWPDWPDRAALSNLRYALSDLRRAIGDRQVEPPFLLITRDSLQFNTASDHWLDIAAFTKMVEADRDHPSATDLLEQAIALYQGSFLAGFSVGDSPAFEDWALFARERLAREVSSALHHLAAIYEQRGEYAQAQSCAWRQVELEPYDEAAHAQLMRGLALGGQRSAALAQFESCRRLLAEELSVEPSQETMRLYELIRTGKLRGPEPALASPREVTAGPPPWLGAEPPQVEMPVFVARERELAQLDRFLNLALAGQGRVAFVTGEAGSGKTTLVQEFTRRVQDRHDDLVVASGNCNAYTGVGDPYLPFREILELLTGDIEPKWAARTITSGHACRLWRTFPLAAQVLLESGPDLIDTLVPRSPLVERALSYTQWPGRLDWLTRLDELGQRKLAIGPGSSQRSDLFEQYTRVLQALARRGPLVLVVDDLQWADPGSISLLFHLGRQLMGSRILVAGAYRPEEVYLGRDGARHPLEKVINELQRGFGEITVNLGQAESRHFVDAFLDNEPNRLGLPFREMLFRQTRGNPLFTVELLRGMQERGDLVQDTEGSWHEGSALDWDTLPARVEAAVAERIGRLAQPLRAALRVASVEGEVFTAEVVARVQAAEERDVVGYLSAELDRKHRLIRAQGIQRVDGQRLSRYRFRHILSQKYLYGSLDDVERVLLHEAVGTTLEALYGDQSEAMTAIAGELARHFQEAGIVEKAIAYLRQAGERAVRLSAYEEAIALLTGGLDMLMTLPDSRERALKELDLQLALGVAHMGGAWAFSDMETAYARARELSLQTGKVSELCHTLGQLVTVCYLRAENHRARELGEEALRLAEQSGDPLLAAVAHWRVGYASFALGDFAGARAHLAHMIAYHEPQHHPRLVFLCGSDAGVSAVAYDACCLWCLGFPDQALRRGQEALALARELDHPFTLAEILLFVGCLVNQMRRDAPELLQYADELTRLAHYASMPTWVSIGDRGRGAALAMMGQVEEAIVLMGEGIAADRSRDLRLHLPTELCFMAEAQARAGRPTEGLATLADALTIVNQYDERKWEAELYRVRSELLLALGSDAEAEASLFQAIDVARRQKARSWELRAATSLGRLWQRQGRRDEARELVGRVYGWFSEGFDTPDLVDAKSLLDTLE